MKRFPWDLSLAALPALILLIVLGVWQVQRLHWKEGLIAQAETAAKAPPALLDEVMQARDPEFRRAVVVCPGLPTAPFVELQTIQDGTAGVRLVSLCRPPDGSGPFLIDRGFVADGVSARPREATSTLPLSLLVELRRTPPPGRMTPPPEGRHFYGRDGAAMARALGVASASPWTLYALQSSNPEMKVLQPSAPPAAFSNNHLGYALTWFGLAVALVAIWAVMVRRRLREGDPA